MDWQARMLGFFSAEDLETFRESTVFVPGCGAIGSAVLQVLARSGVGHFIIADFDNYGEENLPGQLFCDRTVIGRPKKDVVRERILQINPQASIEAYGPEWMSEPLLSNIFARTNVTVLGVDSLSAGILVHRAAKQYRFPVVDFYYSTALSTFVTMPDDPSPETRFEYPTLGKPPAHADTYDVAKESMLRLSAFVFMNCPWLFEDIAPSMLREFLQLQRIPVLPSLVVMAGAVMAEETLTLLRTKKPSAGYRGWFFDWRRQRTVLAVDPSDEPVRFLRALADLRARRSGA